MGFKPQEIAVLAEGETAFGNQFGHPLKNDSDRKPLLTLSFPRNIAHVRNAYQDTPGMANALRNSGDSLPRSDLPLSLRENGEAEKDSIASFSAQDAISQEAMLIGVADKLRRERIKVALIFATDPLDRLFLLQYLRKTCPDTRIALFDADRVLSRPTEASSYLGTIEFSYFPISGTVVTEDMAAASFKGKFRQGGAALVQAESNFAT